MRTAEFAHLTAEAPLTVKASSVLLAAFLFFIAAMPVLVIGAAVVA
jgi:hypothetical protein